MLSLLLSLTACRDSTNLYVSFQGDGNCFDTPCSFTEAMLTLRVADVLIVKDKVVYPPSYPCPLTDMVEAAVQANVTIQSEAGTVINGKLMTGSVMYYLENQRKFTWGKWVGFTFTGFSKLIMSRMHSWSTFPQMVFQDCIFEGNTHDLFSTTGGHWVFINCVFKNNTGRVFKALSETTVEFTDCVFEDSQAVFGYGADLIFRNCVFKNTFGQRGGAVHAAKSTLYVNGCKFINTKASANGGAIYIRDSHEKYQSEVSNSCFLGTQAAMNGTAIYSYLSDLEVRSNIYAGGEESFYAFTSTIHGDGNVYNGDAERCIREHEPLNEEDLYYPCDTYQRHELDDAHGNIFLDFSNPDDPLEQFI